MPEYPLDYAPPTGKMEECSAGVGEDEIVPAPLVAGSEQPYSDCGLRSVQDVTTGNGPDPSVKKSRSIRVQEKAWSRRRSRGSVRSRLR